VLARWGRLDCAFNNAGVADAGRFTVDATEEDWDRVNAINLKGVWLCMRREIRDMLKTGGGAVVNTASVAGLVGWRGSATYSATKHGVIGLTRAAAAEYAKQGIRINAVNPGIINTAAYAQHDLDYNALIPTPVGRIAEPEEIANAAAWLLSDQASYVTGHSLELDGGRTTAAFVV